MKRIGFAHYNCDLKKNGKVKGQMVFIVCKLTNKVALISADGLAKIAPLIIQNTTIMNGECHDGDYCYNLDCKYCKTENFERAINGSAVFREVYKYNPEGTEDFIKDNIQFVEEHIDTNWDNLESTEVCDLMSISV